MKKNVLPTVLCARNDLRKNSITVIVIMIIIMNVVPSFICYWGEGALATQKLAIARKLQI